MTSYNRTHDALAAIWNLFTIWCVATVLFYALDQAMNWKENRAAEERHEYYAELLSSCLNGSRIMVGRTLIKCLRTDFIQLTPSEDEPTYDERKRDEERRPSSVLANK